MGRTTPQRRPWLAALLAVLITGLGHLYLRRWRRAIGWLAVSFGVSALFVEPATIEQLASGNGDLDAVVAAAPLLLVVASSVVDAYLLARTRAGEGAPGGAEEESVTCPHCGNELDPDIDFCHWCTRSIADDDRDRSDDA